MELKVNITPTSYPPLIQASQYDREREIIVNLKNDGDNYTPEAGTEAVLQGTKPSGLGFTVTGEIEGSKVTFLTTEEMTDEPGRIPCEIVLTAGTKRIGTTNALLDIEASPHPDGTTDGTAEHIVSEITAILNETKEAEAAAKDAAERAIEATEGIKHITAEAITLPAGSQATADYEDEHLTLGIPVGNTGPAGPAGSPGQRGEPGKAATIKVGTVTEGDTPAVTNRGTDTEAVLDFVLQRGQRGETGQKGDPGESGKAATIRVGTVTEGNAPAVTNSGTETEAVLDFVLQRGQQGERGSKGDTGAPGTAATIQVGTVIEGDTPAVTNVGTETAAVFNFTLQRGPKGDTGAQGPAYTLTETDKATITAAVLDQLENAETIGM